MDQEQLVRIFKALGDGKRLEILRLINAEDDICACNILESMDIVQSGLSQHIKILCNANLITCRRDGKWMHYSINRETFEKIGHLLQNIAL